LLTQLSTAHTVEQVGSPIRALAKLAHEVFDGVYVTSEHLNDALQMGALLQNDRILREMPDGVVVLDADNTILWGNGRLAAWFGVESVVGLNFYKLLKDPEIIGPDFCPFHTALAGQSSSSTLRTADNKYYQVHAAPLRDGSDSPRHLIVTVHDVTQEMLQQQKFDAIHKAGIELADLKPEEMLDMSAEERIELLKSNILHFTKDVLHYDVVEVRLLDQETGRLEPLLAEGMTPEAANRELFSLPQNNGVTGFVAATGKSYLCEDTAQDPLYLLGARDARSSLTVPLLLHDEVIGTFNVESPKPRAFTESDLKFLEIFSRDLAMALNTLDLLAAEMASTAFKSVEAIHSAVALPVDEILNDAVNIMEKYIGHDPEVVERLRNILKHTRDIKQVIQKVGRKMAPSTAHPQPWQTEERPKLRNRQILVVDADEQVRGAAHALLERYGCNVETAHNGNEAVWMVRSGQSNCSYGCIIADIRLPDMNGFELMCKLGNFMQPLPLVLMTGFGYDPGHSIVKARQAGLKHVLYKPFRLDQLLDTVETMVS
jgi:CheY-like chemotaxis protein/putative methionine-R-sulfoxide reductase with GAF domain